MDEYIVIEIKMGFMKYCRILYESDIYVVSLICEKPMKILRFSNTIYLGARGRHINNIHDFNRFIEYNINFWHEMKISSY